MHVFSEHSDSTATGHGRLTELQATTCSERQARAACTSWPSLLYCKTQTETTTLTASCWTRRRGWRGSFSCCRLRGERERGKQWCRTHPGLWPRLCLRRRSEARLMQHAGARCHAGVHPAAQSVAWLSTHSQGCPAMWCSQCG